MEIPKGELPAPEFGRPWINSRELTLAELRGRVVLIDFWDYTCVNCLRTLPYLLEWDRRYRDQGLTIIGVHAPEFFFARSAQRVRNAVQDLGIRYPVVLDNEYQIWRTFANRYWPAKYLIDNEGFLRYVHYGEGSYEETERAIQALLREINPHEDWPPPLQPIRDTDAPGAVCYPVTPELYLGYQRGRPGNPEEFRHETPTEFTLPEKRQPDLFYLEGRWTPHAEFLESACVNRQPARLTLHYTAKEVNLVMALTVPEECRLRLRQDGKSVAREDAGADVELSREGESLVRVSEPKMYRLVQNRRFGSRQLELETAQTGLGLFAFTFVSCTAHDTSSTGSTN